MQVVDVYTKKEYKCKQCNAPVFYGQITNDSGDKYTEDGQPPNGKFGRDSNVISGAVDAASQSTLHGCSKHYVEEAVIKATAPKGTKESEFKAEFVREPELRIWNDIVSKVTEYTILANIRLEEYTEIQNPALKGLITKVSFDVLHTIQERDLRA